MKYVLAATFLLLVSFGFAEEVKPPEMKPDLQLETRPKRTRLFERAATGLYDGSFEATGRIQADKYFETVGISTTTVSTPATGHAKVYLSSSTRQVLIKFDDGTVTAISGTTGDITSVLAGLGIVGGGTTGDVTVNLSTPITVAYMSNIFASSNTWTASQQFTSSSTFVGNVGISSAVLTHATINNFHGGWIMVQYSSASVTASSSTVVTTAFVKTNLALTITPRSTSSIFKIYVSGSITTSSTAGNDVFANVIRNTTDLSGSGGICTGAISATANQKLPCAMTLWDAPATTSATTYTVGLKSGTGTVQWGTGSSNTSILIVEEWLN